MTTYFYHHLIPIQDIIILLDQHDIDEVEREELEQLIEETIHHQVLNVVFTHLPPEHHESFVLLFAQDPGSIGLIEFIQTKSAVDISAEISKHGKRAAQEIVKEIHKAKKKI